MAFRKMLPLTLLATLVLVPSAEAKYRVGVGDQNAAMFDSARWQSLKLKRTRYIVPWNWNKDAGRDRRGHGLHEPRPRRAPAGAGRLHGPQRLLERRPLLAQQGLPRAQRQGLPQLVPGVRQRSSRG